MKRYGKSALVLILMSQLLSCSSINLGTGAGGRSPASVARKIQFDEKEYRELLQYYRDLAGISAGASEAQILQTFLDVLAQTYVVGEILMDELDQKFEQGQTLEQLINTPKGARNVYAEMLALRGFTEGLKEVIKGMGALSFNQGLESTEPQEKRWGFKLDQEIESSMKKHSEHLALLNVAFMDVKTFAEDLKEYSNTGDLESFGLNEAFRRESTILSVRELRKSKRAKSVQVLKAFAPSEGEAGVNVLKWVTKNSKNMGSDLKSVFGRGRGPAQDGLKIFPSAGASGNITGSGFPKGTWSLTYDDGPAKTTPEVISNLKKHEMKATFFMLSQQIDGPKKFPETARREVSEGHATASHSYTHPQVSKLGAAQRVREIEGAAKVFEDVLGKRPDFFRLPYGAGVSISAVRQDILKSCMVHVFWNVDTLDWHDKDPDLIYQRSVKQVEQLGRGVILFHDIHAQSVVASEKLMGYLKSKGNRMVTIPEIVNEINGGKTWSCKLGW